MWVQFVFQDKEYQIIHKIWAYNGNNNDDGNDNDDDMTALMWKNDTEQKSFCRHFLKTGYYFTLIDKFSD